MRGRIALALVTALVLLAAGIVFAADATTAPQQTTTYQSCAKTSANSPADCASPCYFLRIKGGSSGWCGYGISSFDGEVEIDASGVVVVPLTDMQVEEALGVPGEPTPSPDALSKELRSDYKPASKSVATKYDLIFQKCGQQYGVPADRLRAHAKAESNFQPNAVSWVGARGLMQIMPCTAKDLGLVSNPACAQCKDGTTNCLACTGDCKIQGVIAGSQDEANILDPEKNICAGALYLKMMFERFASWECAAAAYNSGPSNARKYSCNVPFAETVNYVAKVSQYYNDFTRAA